MKIANLNGRVVLVDATHALDIEAASDKRFSSDPQAIYHQWEEFVEWANGISVADHPDKTEFKVEELGPVVPRPAQNLLVGLNYRDHAEEADLAIPDDPLVFTKFVSALTGPYSDVPCDTDALDWEVELVAVIGKGGRNISQADAWQHVAGITVGQDLSDRTIQWMTPPAQFSVGKSRNGYGPLGPVLLTTDAIPGGTDSLRLNLKTSIISADGTETVVQDGNTEELIFSVPKLVEWLSSHVELLPGDLIWTGTPAGVGMAFDPPRYLQKGETVVTSIEGIGEMRNRMV